MMIKYNFNMWLLFTYTQYYVSLCTLNTIRNRLRSVRSFRRWVFSCMYLPEFVRLVSIFLSKSTTTYITSLQTNWYWYRYLLRLQLVMDLSNEDLVQEVKQVPPLKVQSLDSFLKKYRMLTKRELQDVLNVSIKEILDIMSESIDCVGCRRR